MERNEPSQKIICMNELEFLLAESIKKFVSCIRSILRQILKQCHYMNHISDPGNRTEELRAFLDVAAERGAVDCAQILAGLHTMDFGHVCLHLFLVEERSSFCFL